MGYQIDITDRVTIELRRESVVLYVDNKQPSTPMDTIEFHYNNLDDVIRALERVRHEDRYQRWKRLTG